MENNLENKSRFFAQHWGQEVFGSLYLEGSWSYTGVNFDEIGEEDFLILKHLSSITDEDADKTGFGKASHFTNAIRRNGFENFVTRILSIYDVDYLRSKGYALPYLRLSVEKLIEYGWIKLIQ